MLQLRLLLVDLLDAARVLLATAAAGRGGGGRAVVVGALGEGGLGGGRGLATATTGLLGLCGDGMVRGQMALVSLVGRSGRPASSKQARHGALIGGGSGRAGRTLVGFSIRCDPGGRTRTRLALPVLCPMW